MTPIAIPTPTPLPPVGTPVFDIGAVVDGTSWTRQVAMEGVQWWNIINQNHIIDYAQLALLAVIIIAGIVLIIGALNSDGEDV